MKVEYRTYENDSWDLIGASAGEDGYENSNVLVLIFGEKKLLQNPLVHTKAANLFPNADIVICSTAGDITERAVTDDTVILTAIFFEKTKIKSVKAYSKDYTSSEDIGKELMLELLDEDLKAVLVISNGTHVNGSELVTGLNIFRPEEVVVSGGLAGDGDKFQSTMVGLNENPAEDGIVAIGFYGKNIKVGHGSLGGWDEFGRERIITKSTQNILYELDGQNALDLYKEYLGPFVEELPGSALLFPLSLQNKDNGEKLVRTILSINETDKSMTFAGNMPEGSTVRLMKANFDKLIDASSRAALLTNMINEDEKSIAVLISCVGRKLVLQERCFEEVLAAKKVLGKNCFITGFYSYGEISPLQPKAKCELHNQTMTITTFTESDL